jgi:type II secretory pathway pseudopilin PulG
MVSEMTTLVLSILAIVISLVSALAAVGSWVAARRQLEAAERAKKAETLLALFEFLHQNEQRTYRNNLRDPAIAEVDPTAARAVASAFDFADVFVRHGLVEAPVFLDYWGDQLRFLAQRMAVCLDSPLGEGALTARGRPARNQGRSANEPRSTSRVVSVSQRRSSSAYSPANRSLKALYASALSQRSMVTYRPGVAASCRCRVSM